MIKIKRKPFKFGLSLRLNLRESEKKMNNQKLLQHDIERELEGLTFNELSKIAILINKFYKRNLINLFKYMRAKS